MTEQSRPDAILPDGRIVEFKTGGQFYTPASVLSQLEAYLRAMDREGLRDVLKSIVLLDSKAGSGAFLQSAQRSISTLNWDAVLKVALAAELRKDPNVVVKDELAQSSWGPFIKTLAANGLNAGQILNLLVSIATVIIAVIALHQDQGGPQPIPAPHVDVHVDVPTDEIIDRAIKELEEREQQQPPRHQHGHSN